MPKKKRKPDSEPPDSPPPSPKRKPKRSKVPKPKLGSPSKTLSHLYPPGMIRMRYGRVESRRREFMARKYLVQAEKIRDPHTFKMLVKSAVLLWPDCAQGYVMLAERAASPKQAIDLYEKGVAAGERALCPEFFIERAGQFGFDDETGPYLSARLGLARALWVGRRDETLAHYDEILRLNPLDHQGVRYNLAAALLEMGRDAEFEALLKRYPDESGTTWAYCVALFGFRKNGDTPATRKLREAARECNPHVADYLTGVKAIPLRLPKAFVVGDRNEAIDYAVGFLSAWRATTGALGWIKKTKTSRADDRETAKPPPRKARNSGRGPTVAAKKRLLKLPKRKDATWQADARRLPIWIKIAGEPCRPWVLVVASRNDDVILALQVLEKPPTTAQIWDTLTRAMSSDDTTAPHRPTGIDVGCEMPLEGLIGDLDDLGIHVRSANELDLLDNIYTKLCEHMNGRPLPLGLLDMPAVGPEQAAAFFRAAASFYRAAPWQRIGGGETLQVACDRFESGPWFAVVVGQMGMTRGLGLYESLDELRQMRDGDGSDEENARKTVALSVTFGDQTELPVADLDAAGQLGWEIASPDAYPTAIRKERGMMMRPPLAWELRLLEACLYAIPDFIDVKDRDDVAPVDFDVPTQAGALRLSISWTAEST